jgi:hypothetical protein
MIELLHRRGHQASAFSWGLFDIGAWALALGYGDIGCSLFEGKVALGSEMFCSMLYICTAVRQCGNAARHQAECGRGGRWSSGRKVIYLCNNTTF